MSVKRVMLSVTAMLTAATQLETTTAAAELDLREMDLHAQVHTATA